MTWREQCLYEFEQFRLDALNGRLWKAGEAVPLPPNAIQLLILLVSRQGEVVSKDFLFSTLWPDIAVQESNLTQNIYVLRKALGQTADGESFIATLSKRGYRFVPAVEVVDVQLAPEPAKEEVEAETAAELLPPRTNRRTPALAAAALILVAAAGLYEWLWKRDSVPGPIGSIVVLPFKTINAAGNEEFLGPGMAETLTTRLSKAGQFKIASARVAQRYFDKSADPLEAGRALHVEAVLTGSVQQNGSRLRLTVLLLNIRDGRTLWAEQFDEKFTDVLLVQDVLAERLAQSLTASVKGSKLKRLPERETSNPEAYQLYMKGRYFWNRRSPEWIAKAIACFQQATKLDPHYLEPMPAWLTVTRFQVQASRHSNACRRPRRPRSAHWNWTTRWPMRMPLWG
jgi:DNA-binding winged helix-turn-helix (wHTH) protein/TolB-like protein